MRNKTVKVYLTIILVNCSLYLNAQSFDTILTKLDSQYRQEKLYLHFDRSAYSPGETIWFKAYLFAGNVQSDISKTIYAELTDDKGKVLERKTAPAILSSAASFFDIPKDFTGSVVYVRAYTKWMLNFDSTFLYNKAIPVLNAKQIVNKSTPSTQKTTQPIAKKTSSYLLHFFPEGGDLVEDVESRVAFKATMGTGLPANVAGNIFDSKKNKIISFSSAHDGMGSFILQPKTGEKYTAVWKDASGEVHETILPLAKQNGIVLEVNAFANEIVFKIRRSANALPYPFVYVVAQMNQELLYRAKANFSKSTSPSGVIPSANFPAGIVQVTVFTPDEKPIAERITFINPAASSFITDLNAAIKNLDKRKRNVIQVDVPDTLLTNLSVAVTDADLDPVQERENIFSGVLLTSDIKGYVHNPAYYFSSDADSVSQHLDLVMMTNGWRRFKWDEVLSGHFVNIKHMPENYLSIEGRMYGVNKTLMANKEINSIIQLKNGNKQFLNTALQPEGRFVYPNMIFYDTAKFYYQINNDKRQALTTRASFEIKNSFLKESLRYKPDSSLLLSVTIPDPVVQARNTEIYKEQLTQEELNKVKVLKDVVITTRKKTKQEVMDEEYSSGLFSGSNAKIMIPDDDPSSMGSRNVFEYLQSKVAGLQIIPNGGDYVISWRGSATALFVNEMSADVTQLQSISMSDIAMVKIFPPPFFGAVGGGGGGAIAVYQKKGASAMQAIKGLDYVNITGYSPIREFYSPDYSKPDDGGNPDLRKTLYWNPFVITDKKNRRILLPFYNNDITKKIKIIIEGCDEEGKLTRIEKVLQ